MTDDDDITVIPMKELTWLRRIEAAAQNYRNSKPLLGATEETEIALIELDIALMEEGVA